MSDTTTKAITKDEARRRIEAALAEVGYPGARLEGGTWVNCPRPNSPHAIAAFWMAGYISGHPTPCWACWEASNYRTRAGDDASRCFEGDCQHPEGPAKPPILRGGIAPHD